MKPQALFNVALSLSLLGLTTLPAAANQPIISNIQSTSQPVVIPQSAAEIAAFPSDVNLAKKEQCYEQSGYPLGRWEVSTNSSNSPNSKFSTFVIFTRPKAGTWISSTGPGTFKTSVILAPSQEVVLTYRAGSYRSINTLVVSSDGCRMDGTFLDINGISGDTTYTWEPE